MTLAQLTPHAALCASLAIAAALCHHHGQQTRDKPGDRHTGPRADHTTEGEPT